MPCNKEVILKSDKIEVLVIDLGYLAHCIGVQSSLCQVFQQCTRERGDEVEVVVRVQLLAQVLCKEQERSELVAVMSSDVHAGVLLTTEHENVS